MECECAFVKNTERPDDGEMPTSIADVTINHVVRLLNETQAVFATSVEVQPTTVQIYANGLVKLFGLPYYQDKMKGMIGWIRRRVWECQGVCKGQYQTKFI